MTNVPNIHHHINQLCPFSAKLCQYQSVILFISYHNRAKYCNIHCQTMEKRNNQAHKID